MAAEPSRQEAGSAVVDFVLIMVILIPLVLGILQVGLVLHVRNTLIAAVSDGARFGAAINARPDDGAHRARLLIRTSIADRYAGDVRVTEVMRDGLPQVVVSARTTVPALGLGGPGFSLAVSGHAVKESLK